MVIIALGFKIAAFPFQIWAPDVYEGAPVPTTAFLAIGSKAAGFVLLLRLLFTAVPQVTIHWSQLLIIISAITILYGNLCALPQRNLKRMLGYSSIAHAGYLLLGIAALSGMQLSALARKYSAHVPSRSARSAHATRLPFSQRASIPPPDATTVSGILQD